MKQLEIPYIGVKIEAIYTILETLKESSRNDEFVIFFVSKGKSPKTALEYLASLRNLRLAKRSTDGSTVILKSGEDLLNDSIKNLYINLLNHCLKNFPDLKILRDIIKREQVKSLPDLISSLNQKGYTVKREKTLSSYLKLFYEGNTKNLPPKKQTISFSKKGDDSLEYNQFVKLLKNYILKQKTRKIIIHEFAYFLFENYNLTDAMFKKYLGILKSEEYIKLYEVNPRVLKDENEGVNINNKVYYYLELI